VPIETRPQSPGVIAQQTAAPAAALVFVPRRLEVKKHWTFGKVVSIWLPVLICVIAIAIESTQLFGADHTTGPLRGLIEFFLGHIGNSTWETVHHVIRKTGHFVGYGILSISWFRAFWLTYSPRFAAQLAGYGGRLEQLGIHALAMLGTLLVASADEIHQAFLPNRTGRFADVLLDCSGALVMQVLVWIYVRWRG
jgi:VanZ family protein